MDFNQKDNWGLKVSEDLQTGFQIEEITENNFSQYAEIIRALTLKAIDDGRIKIAKRNKDNKILKDDEVVAKFSSKGDAGDHRRTQMGCYMRTLTHTYVEDEMGYYVKAETERGSAVFEQVTKQEEDEKYYLFVGKDGCWRVATDIDSDIGSMLKHPEKNVAYPPSSGWFYYLNDKWNKDDSLHLTVNRNVTEEAQSKNEQQKKIHNKGSCTLVNATVYYVEKSPITPTPGVFSPIETRKRTFKNVTCLGVAILRGDTFAIETSLQNGCDINFDKIEETSYGLDIVTPLVLACEFCSLSVVSMLLEHPEIEINKRNDGDRTGRTALSQYVRRPQNLDLVKLLVKAGANIHLRYWNGYSNIHYAVESSDNLEMVKYLHTEGASLHTHDSSLVTPMWTAVEDGNIDMVCYLAENGAYLDSPNASCYGLYGFSPFNMAVFCCHVDIVKFMIGRGADVTAKDNNGKTNIEIAQKKITDGENDWQIGEFEEIIRLLKVAEKDLQPDEDFNACNCSRNGFVKCLPDSEDSWIKFQELNCLENAILQNDMKAVEISLENCVCSINFDKTKRYDGGLRCGGWTPLMLACCKSTLPIVSLLVEQPGININKVNERNESALAWAVKRDDNLDMVKFLVEAGADPDMRCEKGRSHLHQAADKMQLEIVKYLQSKGAYINTQDKEKTTPLFLAIVHGDLEIIKYLKSQGAILDASNDSFVMKPDEALIYNLICETLEEIMWIWAEKIGIIEAPFPSWNWPTSELPVCVQKLQIMTENHEVWITMVQALVELESALLEHPLGPIAIEILITNTLFIHVTNIDDFFKLIKMASSFDPTAPDMFWARHDIPCRELSVQAIWSIILSCFARYIRRFLCDKDVVDMSQQTITPDMLDYIFSNLKPDSTPEASIFSLLTLEFLSHEEEKGKNPNAEIIQNRFSEFSKSDHPLLRIIKMLESDNFSEKQAGFCAEWYLANQWSIDNTRRHEISNNKARLIPSSQSEYLKIGSNGLEVRANGPCFETVMSTVEVNEGSWYYEVTLVSCGLMQIGWATKQSTFLEKRGHGVGDDQFSESYDGCRQVVWYNRLQPDVPARFSEKNDGPKPHGWVSKGNGQINSWKPGDVVGLLIDLENQEIVFSLNGTNIIKEPYKDVFEKVNEGFFAAISLMSHQHCQVNFGLDIFKHPPEGRKFKPLNEGTSVF